MVALVLQQRDSLAVTRALDVFSGALFIDRYHHPDLPSSSLTGTQQQLGGEGVALVYFGTGGLRGLERDEGRAVCHLAALGTVNPPAQSQWRAGFRPFGRWAVILGADMD